MTLTVTKITETGKSGQSFQTGIYIYIYILLFPSLLLPQMGNKLINDDWFSKLFYDILKIPGIYMNYDR